MNIHIYYPNEKIAKYYDAAIKEYEKRLSRYCKIKKIAYSKASDLTALTNETHCVIAVHPNGTAHTSESLAELISTTGVCGVSDMDFILLDSSTALPSTQSLSLSKMDMPTQLSLTVAFEQIYRAYRIIHNHAYHK